MQAHKFISTHKHVQTHTFILNLTVHLFCLCIKSMDMYVWRIHIHILSHFISHILVFSVALSRFLLTALVLFYFLILSFSSYPVIIVFCLFIFRYFYFLFAVLFSCIFSDSLTWHSFIFCSFSRILLLSHILSFSRIKSFDIVIIFSYTHSFSCICISHILCYLFRFSFIRSHSVLFFHNFHFLLFLSRILEFFQSFRFTFFIFSHSIFLYNMSYVTAMLCL